MSLSWIRTKPSMLDPSNQMPSSRAFSSWVAGIETFLTMPRMSVNWSRTKSIFSSSIRSKISLFDVIKNLGVVGTKYTDGSKISPFRASFGTNLQGLFQGPIHFRDS